MADLPTFGPMPTREPDPLGDHRITTPTRDDDGDDRDGWAEPDVDLGPPATSRTSTGSSRASIDPSDLKPVTAALVGMASLLVRWMRSRRRPIHPQAWVADDEDVDLIGDPLARIAARHAPISGEGSADTIDGAAALMGTANYVMKNIPLEGQPYDLEQLPDDDAPDAGAGFTPGV